MKDLKTMFSMLKKIELLVTDPETQIVRTYRSRIEDVHERYLTIGAPYAKLFFLPPHIGTEYNGRIAGENCSYLFRLTLLRYIREPFPLWVVSLPQDIRRVQLRGFFRLNINLSVQVYFAAENGEENDFYTWTKDLSSGGCRIIMEQAILSAGGKVRVLLPLSEGDPLEVKGEVIKVNLPETDSDKYEACIKFVDMTEKIRGKIIRYIYRKQIERRKRERELFEE